MRMMRWMCGVTRKESETNTPDELLTRVTEASQKVTEKRLQVVRTCNEEGRGTRG